MKKHPFNFEAIRCKVYSLEYAEDKADYLADMFVRISTYMAEHPEFQTVLQPMASVISLEMEHYRKHALADSQQGIRQPHHPAGLGRPRRDSTSDIVPIEKSPKEILQEESLERQIRAYAIKSMADPDRLSYKEAAELLGLAHGTIQKYASQGKIPSHKTPTGGKFMYRSEILAWKDSKSDRLAKERADLLAKVEGQKPKFYRPSRERRKEERKQDIKKLTSQEIEEAYKKMKHSKSK